MTLLAITSSCAFEEAYRFRVSDLQLRVTARTDLISRNGTPYTQYKLADISQSINAIAWWDTIPKSQVDSGYGAIVNVAGEFLQRRGSSLLNLRSIQLVDPARIGPEALFSSAWFQPASSQYVDEFLLVFNAIQNRYLREFFIDAMLCSFTALGYVSAQGSLRHHHAYPGGLFEHSVMMAYQVMVETEAGWDSTERDIAMTVALLHDIGKTVTLAGRNITTQGRYQPHDMSALELLAQPLQRLERERPQLAAEVRKYFKPKSWSPVSQSRAIELVRYVD